MMNRKDIESISRLLREEVFDKQEGSPEQEQDKSLNEPRYNKSMNTQTSNKRCIGIINGDCLGKDSLRAAKLFNNEQECCDWIRTWFESYFKGNKQLKRVEVNFFEREDTWVTENWFLFMSWRSSEDEFIDGWVVAV